MPIDSVNNVFIIIFSAIAILGLFVFYVLYYRGQLLKKELGVIFNCGLSDCDHGQHDNQSLYMRHEGGGILAHVNVDESNEVLIYQFAVNGQVNMMRFLVHVQRGVELDDAIYGGGHVARECKAHKLYSDYRHITKLQDKVNYLSDAISVIEVYKGVAYCYYRLNSFIGFYPMNELFLMIKKTSESIK